MVVDSTADALSEDEESRQKEGTRSFILGVDETPEGYPRSRRLHVCDEACQCVGNGDVLFVF